MATAPAALDAYREEADRFIAAVEEDGEEIGFRLLRPALANEPDRDRRERLDRARVELSETQLNPHYVTIAETRREAITRLGAANYRELYTRFGFPLEELGAQCEHFLAETEELFVSAFDRLFRRRVGVSLEEARRWDVPRLFRAPEWDSGFPASKMVPALESTLDGLGIDLRTQE